MGTYSEQQQLADDETFLRRVRHAAIKAALDVNGEVQGANSVLLWKARSRLAVEILRAPVEWAVRFAKAVVAQDPTMTAAVADAALQGSVNAVFSDLAHPQAEG